MGTTTDTSSPFGHYALPPAREAVRLAARRSGGGRLGRWAISLRRKRAIRGLSEPFDVAVAPGVNARLYPSTNRCEKRALCGVQVWDPVERDALRGAIEAHRDDAPFTFLDVGANVGLYSLFAHSYALSSGTPIRIVAVEPNPEIADRLVFNAEASGAQFAHARVAISSEPGHVFMHDGGGNRGEAAISDDRTDIRVRALPLADLCAELDITRIHALKIDIEGHDVPALSDFFRDVPAALHPDMMILELSAMTAEPLIAVASAHDYLITEATSMNAIFHKRTA